MGKWAGSRIGQGLFLLLFAYLAAIRPTAAPAAVADRPTPLFTPTFVKNDDPLCAGLSKAVSARISSGASWDSLGGAVADGDTGLTSLADAEPDGDVATDTIVTIGKVKVFVRPQTLIGCGGACDSASMVVSDRSASDDGNPDAHSQTDRGSSWTLYQGPNGRYYISGMTGENLRVYRIAGPKSLEVACEVWAAPTLGAALAGPATHAAAVSIRDFGLAVAGVTGGTDGTCGTMQTASRWAYAVNETLLQIMYRPQSADWEPKQPAIPSENSFGNYDLNMKYLQAWSMGGVFERQAFQRYQTQFADTAHQLSALYVASFHLAEPEARRLAERNLRAAVSQGLGFYMYDSPYSGDAEREFRQGVFDRVPMDQLDKLAAAAWPQGLPAGQENIIALAVSYPDALSVLFKRGAKANLANAFGKTPLMYAAQFNELRSVELLLEHGADPNAATIWPEDTCTYQLRTAGMTALHYAVRYASADVVRLLVSKGALTFGRTDKALYSNDSGEYPIDWLARYTDQSSADRNPNITPADLAGLEPLLQVPSDSDRSKIADGLVKQAEADYAKGNAEDAYHKLTAALTASPSQERALGDMALVALKTHRLNESLKTANAVVAATTSSQSSRASAWFNQGLACEQVGHMVVYEGQLYCDYPPLHPFLESWKAEHTPARAHKLEDLFANTLKSVCTVSVDSQKQYYYFAADVVDPRDRDLRYIYVLHPNTQTVAPTDVHPQAGAALMPAAVERDDLGDLALTVLKWKPDLRGSSVPVHGDSCSIQSMKFR